MGSLAHDGTVGSVSVKEVRYPFPAIHVSRSVTIPVVMFGIWERLIFVFAYSSVTTFVREFHTDARSVPPPYPSRQTVLVVPFIERVKVFGFVPAAPHLTSL